MPLNLKLWSNAFQSGKRIPERYAFAKPDPRSHFTLSDNINPPLAWTGVPASARSLVLVCHDPDVPSRPDDVNQEGRIVPADLPRVDFFHWLLVDLPPKDGAIAEGEFSRGVRARGKSGPAGPRGTRQGLNNFTQWFAGDEQMKGEYFGYDGPAPPWNDARLHHYHFTLYALDVERCAVEGKFSGPDVRAALEGHVLAQASYMGTYSLNPAVQG